MGTLLSNLKGNGSILPLTQFSRDISHLLLYPGRRSSALTPGAALPPTSHNTPLAAAAQSRDWSLPPSSPASPVRRELRARSAQSRPPRLHLDSRAIAVGADDVELLLHGGSHGCSHGGSQGHSHDDSHGQSSAPPCSPTSRRSTSHRSSRCSCRRRPPTHASHVGSVGSFALHQPPGHAPDAQGVPAAGNRSRDALVLHRRSMRLRSAHCESSA
mmetsp:Transcript_29704/g.77057  ORF Transcript_29704/g.77057 Transcript_29704/m.77057 type:complete len:215 (-) Transcript_29704:98-742(-)